MSGINTGILTNAHPLSTDHIKELEAKVLNGGGSFAYLDENSRLCFAMHKGVDGIKELAWDSAYELTNAGSLLTKRAYKKTGLKTFVLDSIYTKPSLNASWTVGEIPIFEFDGSIEGRPYVYSDRHDAMLVKVSDSVLTSQMLLGSTLTYITGNFGADVENTFLLDNAEYVCSIIGDSGTEEGCLVETVDGCHIVSVSNSWLLPDFFNWDIELEPGTYFMVYSSESAEVLGFSKIYTKSISCLTIADATNPTTATAERLEGDGQEFYTAAPSTLSFRSTAPLSEFQDVQINGQTVDPSNYTLEEGSTIVKLKHDYLSTLNAGKYEVSVVSNNKIVSGDFIVNVPELSEYGFYYNRPYSISLTEYVEDSAEPISYVISIFSINSDNTVLRFDPNNGERLDATFELEGRHFKLQFELYEIIGVFSADGSVAVESFNVLGEPVDNTAIIIKVDNELACADKYYYYIRKEGTFEEWIVAPKASNETWYPKIPSTIKDMPVTFLAEYSFRENTSITSLEMISDNINTFGSLAFYGCSSITSLYIPDHVSDFWSQCFSNCTALQSISLPAGLSALEDYLFSGCTNLREIIYRGTKAECEQLLENWRTGIVHGVFSNVPATHIVCSDGQVAL